MATALFSVGLSYLAYAALPYPDLSRFGAPKMKGIPVHTGWIAKQGE
jgi:hypothetical protein